MDSAVTRIQFNSLRFYCINTYKCIKCIHKSVETAHLLQQRHRATSIKRSIHLTPKSSKTQAKRRHFARECHPLSERVSERSFGTAGARSCCTSRPPAPPGGSVWLLPGTCSCALKTCTPSADGDNAGDFPHGSEPRPGRQAWFRAQSPHLVGMTSLSWGGGRVRWRECAVDGKDAQRIKKLDVEHRCQQSTVKSSTGGSAGDDESKGLEIDMVEGLCEEQRRVFSKRAERRWRPTARWPAK